MPDIFTPEKRSEVMSRIRSKNTKAELLVFRFLRSRKIYFQKHYKRVKGLPDIALPRKKLAVFVDGDFWHGRGFEERRPKFEANGQEYWIKKIERNMRNDIACAEVLAEKGWRILRVWESDIVRKRTRDAVFEEVELFLTGN